MRVLTISAGSVRTISIPDRDPALPVHSAIVKHPLSTLADPRPVDVGTLGIAGDEHADRTVHGGPAKAVYLYPAEHYPVWQTMRRQAGHAEPLPHGWLGENLTIEGLTEHFVWVGDVLRVGNVALRVESARSPCFKFDARMGFAHASKMMNQSGYTGFYCSVECAGTVSAGDVMTLSQGDRVVSVAEAHRLRVRSRSRRSF